jgi:tetratricopeptide (TPR) repeat protein
LVRALAGLSTALVLATAYMRQTGLSVQDYHLLYQHKKAALLKEGPLNIKDADLPIALSAQLSLAHLQSPKPLAELDWILKKCAYLSPKHIPKTLLFLEPSEAGFDELSSTFKPLLARLAAYGFMQLNTSTVSIDPRLQQVLRHQDPSPDQSYARVARACILAFHQSASTTDPGYHQKQLLTSLEALSHYDPQNPSAALDNLKSCLLFYRALLYYAGADLQKAQDLFEQALSLQEHVHGAKHPVLASTLFNMSLIYERWEDLEQQKICLKRALQIIEEAHDGSTHPPLITVLRKLAEIYGRLNNLEESYRLLLLVFKLELPGSDEAAELSTLLEELGQYLQWFSSF